MYTNPTSRIVPIRAPKIGTNKAIFISCRNVPVRLKILDKKTILFQLQKIRQLNMSQNIQTTPIMIAFPFSFAPVPLNFTEFGSRLLVTLKVTNTLKAVNISMKNPTLTFIIANGHLTKQLKKMNIVRKAIKIEVITAIKTWR